MPLSRRWAVRSRRRNHWLAPLLLRLPRMVSVHHVGRRSGCSYTTPLRLLPASDRKQVYVAMTYGSGSDWFQNLRVNPGTVEVDGQMRTIEAVKSVALNEVPVSGRWQQLQLVVMSHIGIKHLAELTLGGVAGRSVTD